MPRQFIAIDVETANSDRSSICQIGLVAFDQDGLAWEWSSLVNPECDFDANNVRIHGVRSQDVASAPTWPDIMRAISPSLSQRVIVSHSRFDCDASHSASLRYSSEFPSCKWLDSVAVASVAWPELPRHNLKTLCAHFGIELQHHDALSDARACGTIMARAMRETDLGTAEWMRRVGAISPSSRSQTTEKARIRYSEKIEARGVEGGPLSGHVLVCTGEFELGERALVNIASELGCDVSESFTNRPRCWLSATETRPNSTAKRKAISSSKPKRLSRKAAKFQ
jgi:DNA polymerase-3 subunit epsilon